MKKLSFAVLLFISITAAAQKAAPKTVTQTLKPTTTTDSIQYLIGAYVGLWITTNGLSVVNTALFQKGLDDILQKRPTLVPDSLIVPRVAAYQASIQKNKAVEEEKELFASLKDVPGIGMFPNGVRYIIYATGKGQRPAAGDSILLNLIAKLPDGTVVEDTYQSKKPFAATTSSFFPGLNDALQMMQEGSRWQLYVPAILAYGAQGNGRIPPNSALILEVELLSVQPPKS